MRRHSVQGGGSGERCYPSSVDVHNRLGYLDAGPGNDTVYGARDTIDGGTGRDRVMGGRGKYVWVNGERRRSVQLTATRPLRRETYPLVMKLPRCRQGSLRATEYLGDGAAL